MGGLAAPEAFAFVSLCLSAVTVLALVVLAFRSRQTARFLLDHLDSTVSVAREIQAETVKAVAAAKPDAVRDVLSEFEAQLIRRVQTIERAFVELGEEVTEAMDRADQLRRSASAKESRAKARARKLDAREDRELGEPNGADLLETDWWNRDDLSEDQKEALTLAHLRRRGVAV